MQSKRNRHAARMSRRRQTNREQKQSPLSGGFARCEQLEARRLLSADVLGYHNDLASTGQNLAETLLTPTSVKVGTFGKRYSAPVDGQVYAQPLYVSNLNVTGGSSPGAHNVVFVATEHDSLYAIDGDSGAILWQDSFINPAAGITTVPSGDVNSGNIDPEIGITGTPAIDRANNALFLTAKTKQIVNGDTADPHYVNTLYKVNIQSGTYTSTVIGDTTYNASTSVYTYNGGPYVLGTGDGAINVGGQNRVYFNSLRELDRPGLTIAGGKVYIAFGSHGDNGPYHGWILGYDESTLANTAALNTTPNSGLGGIWQAGGSIAMDPQGHMYIETGNGGFDTTLNAQLFPSRGDYGDSFIKIGIDTNSTQTNQNGNINGFGLKVVDYFTPYNQASLNSVDQDLGSGAPMVLPDSVGSAAHPHLMIGSGKEGKLYLIDRDNMGKYGSTDNVVQEQGSAINGSLDTPAFFNDGTTSRIYYVGGYGDTAKSFTIANGAFSATPSSVSNDSYTFPGSTPSISANGTTNGIAWDLNTGTNQLRAYDASNYGNEIWTSGQAAGDQLGSVVKFSVPTVANGHVYVGTANALVAYGPPTPPTSVPPTPTGLTATAVSAVQISLAWTDNANNEDGYTVEQSGDNGATWTPIATLGVNAQSYPVTGLQAGMGYSFRVRAFNVLGPSGYSNVASAITSSQLPALDYSGGFAGATGEMTLNGTATINGTSLQLTSSQGNQAGSAFSIYALADQRFTTTFTLLLTNAQADGMTFTMQSQGSGALGGGGGSLGYAGISPSVAIKFDLYNNSGEGTDSTGLFTDGAAPGENATTFDLTSSGVDLHAGNPLQVTLHYDGTNLTETIFDTVTSASFTHTYAINIPSVLGTNYAYVGFTGATGGAVATQDVQNWTYTPLPTAPPATPTGLGIVAASGTQLNLSWTQPAGQEVDGFKILRAASASGPYSQVNEVAGGQTSYMDVGLNPNTTYYYEIVATNSAGDSQPSQSASALTPIPPATPQNARTTFVGTNEIDLAWDDKANNETGYRIYRKKSTAGDDQFAQIATLAPNSVSYADKGVQPGIEYDYHIQAYNIAGYSDFAGITLWTLPPAPTGSAAAGGAGQIALSWNASAGAATYNIFRSTIPGGEGTTPWQTGITATSFIDSTALPGTVYYYTIAALDPSGEGPASGEVSSAVAPQLASVQVNDGSAQRTHVSSLTVHFNEPVTLAPGAFTLALLNTGGSGKNDGSAPTDLSSILSSTSADGGKTWTITFTSGTDSTGSLNDGIYTLTTHAANVTGALNVPIALGDQTFTFHRLLGDMNGDGKVNFADFIILSEHFGTSVGPGGWGVGDLNDDGQVNFGDFTLLSTHFGHSLTLPKSPAIRSFASITVAARAAYRPGR